jgi:hypothetical protein
MGLGLWLVWFFVICIFFFAGWGWGGWYGRPWWGGGWGGQPAAPPPPAAHAPAPTTVTPAPPGEFLGRTLTVTGQIDQVLNDHTFTLKNPAAAGRDLLVVEKKGVAPKQPPKQGEKVEVKGTVEAFNRGTFEKESGEHLPDTVTTFQDRPALLASSVTVESGNQSARK